MSGAYLWKISGLSGAVNTPAKKFKKSCPSRVGGGPSEPKRRRTKKHMHHFRPPLSENSVGFWSMLFSHSFWHWHLAKKTSWSKKTRKRRRPRHRQKRRPEGKIKKVTKAKPHRWGGIKRREKAHRKKQDFGTNKNTQVKFSAPQRDRGGGRPKGLHSP